MSDQQRLRPACTYAQSDQSLCLSLAYSMNGKLVTEHHLEFLSLRGGSTGSSESALIKIPHCWKSHIMAQMLKSTHHPLIPHIPTLCVDYSLATGANSSTPVNVSFQLDKVLLSRKVTYSSADSIPYSFLLLYVPCQQLWSVHLTTLFPGQA